MTIFSFEECVKVFQLYNHFWNNLLWNFSCFWAVYAGWHCILLKKNSLCRKVSHGRSSWCTKVLGNPCQDSIYITGRQGFPAIYWIVKKETSIVHLWPLCVGLFVCIWSNACFTTLSHLSSSFCFEQSGNCIPETNHLPFDDTSLYMYWLRLFDVLWRHGLILKIWQKSNKQAYSWINSLMSFDITLLTQHCNFNLTHKRSHLQIQIVFIVNFIQTLCLFTDILNA